MLWASLLLWFLHAICGEPIIWGSSVITKTEGPSPTLAYKVINSEPLIMLDWVRLSIKNDTCLLNYQEVGKPCFYEKINDDTVAKINLFSVANHYKLYVSSSGLVHSTYFAPNCIFPTPKQVEAIPKPSMPLTRYMSGHEEVTINFAAFIGDQHSRIALNKDQTNLCIWKDGQLSRGNATICKLTSRNANKERWFTHTFKRNNANSTVYSWRVGASIVVINVDWMQSGTAPDETACHQPLEDTTAKI